MKSVCQYVNCDWVHRVLLQRRGFVQAQAPSCVHPRLCCRFGVEVRLCKGQWSRFQLFDNMFATDNCYSVAWLSCDRWNMAGRKSMMFAPHWKAFKIRARAHAQLENWKEALNRESSNIAGKFAIPVSHFFTGFSEDFRTNPGHSKPLFLATFSHSLGSRSYCGTLHCSALGLVCLVCLVVQDNTRHTVHACGSQEAHADFRESLSIDFDEAGGFALAQCTAYCDPVTRRIQDCKKLP